MSWRDSWRPASFRGVGFHVDISARTGGRRGVNHEFPKRDTPSDEDLGRRAVRWGVTGYVIGPEYTLDADDLEDALNTEGPGLLIHPTKGELLCRCDVYTRTERRTEGGMATFDMMFVEAGTSGAELMGDPTQFWLREEADGAATTLSTRANERAEEAAT